MLSVGPKKQRKETELSPGLSLPQTPIKAAGGPAGGVRPGLLTKNSVALGGPWTKVLIGEKPREDRLPQWLSR